MCLISTSGWKRDARFGLSKPDFFLLTEELLVYFRENEGHFVDFVRSWPRPWGFREGGG